MLLTEEKRAGVDWWRLEGALTIQDVAAAWEAMVAVQPRSPRRMLDMADLSDCDSAGLQLLMAMIADANDKRIKLDIPMWPDCVQDCANILGIALPETN
jgi:ABC-type transporter Mla MlaB component